MLNSYITVNISCAERSTFALSRIELIDAGTNRFIRVNQLRSSYKKPQIEVTDTKALNYCLRKVELQGWQLKNVNDELFIFEGYGKKPVL